MRFWSWVSVRAGAAVLGVLLALSACTVVVEDDLPEPVRPGPLCQRDYDPVCARRGGDSRTFANACLADQSGYRVTRRGECRRQPEERSCSRQYDPVCARRGGDRQTFSNSCLAEEAGYRVVREGECGRDNNDNQRFCTRQYEPVCARRGGQERTFPNECEADVAGFRVVGDGPC
jgi:hypothetical protein